MSWTIPSLGGFSPTPKTIENYVYSLVFEQICEKFSSEFRKLLILAILQLSYFEKIIENISSFGGPPLREPPV